MAGTRSRDVIADRDARTLRLASRSHGRFVGRPSVGAARGLASAQQRRCAGVAAVSPPLCARFARKFPRKLDRRAVRFARLLLCSCFPIQAQTAPRGKFACPVRGPSLTGEFARESASCSGCFRSPSQESLHVRRH
jgi:hypothetical protein